MRSRKKPICDVEIGCRSVTVCHLGNLAYWNHRHLRWDPAKEKFVGDKEANQWLDRPSAGRGRCERHAAPQGSVTLRIGPRAVPARSAPSISRRV